MVVARGIEARGEMVVANLVSDGGCAPMIADICLVVAC